MSLRVGCVECYTATEGAVCVFCWKTADLTCLNRLIAALGEWHSETGIIKLAFIVYNFCSFVFLDDKFSSTAI